MDSARRSLANVAQLVEQLTRNEQVSGSNPLVGSIFLPFSLGRNPSLPIGYIVCPVGFPINILLCLP